MDSLINIVKGAAAAGFSPVWLGETSSAYNGGGKNLSNTFLAGYLWLDKLGVSALYGLDAVLRQEIYGTYQIGDVSSYSLINMDMRPAPVRLTSWVENCCFFRIISCHFCIRNSSDSKFTMSVLLQPKKI